MPPLRACLRISPHRLRLTCVALDAVVSTMLSSCVEKYQLQIAASAAVLPAPLQERTRIFFFFISPLTPASTVPPISSILLHSVTPQRSAKSARRSGIAIGASKSSELFGLIGTAACLPSFGLIEY